MQIYGYYSLLFFTSLSHLSIRKEGNVLFNDALNTFYFTVIWRRTYGKGPLTWATLSDCQQGFFYMHHPTDRITHTMAFITPVVEHWLE